MKNPMMQKVTLALSCAAVGLAVFDMTVKDARIHELTEERDIYASRFQNWSERAMRDEEAISERDDLLDKLLGEMDAVLNGEIKFEDAGEFHCTACFAAGVAMVAFIDDKGGHCYTGAAGRVGLSALVDTSGGNCETAAAGGRDSVLHAVRSFLSVLFIGAAAPKDIGKIVIFEIVRCSVAVHDEGAALAYSGQVIALADLCKGIGADDPALAAVVSDPVNQIAVAGKNPLDGSAGDISAKRAGGAVDVGGVGFRGGACQHSGRQRKRGGGGDFLHGSFSLRCFDFSRRAAGVVGLGRFGRAVRPCKGIRLTITPCLW